MTKSLIIAVSLLMLTCRTSFSCEKPVLGSVDPDVIRRILLEHLPQFRYCFQKEIESRTINSNIPLKFNFIIGSTGHVSRNQIKTDLELPASFTRCLSGVLSEIIFPEPIEAGTIEVNQTFNFSIKEI
jgi:hypothetical protein